MEQATRNLMIIYAIICFLSIAGVALNIIQVFNLRSLEDPKVTEQIVELLSKGFLVKALLYLIITLTSLGTIIKRKYSKSLLIVLAIALVAVFVFSPFIFDLILGDTAHDINFQN